MADQTTREITRLRKTWTTRLGDLRTHNTAQELTTLLDTDLEDPSVRLSTTKKRVHSESKILLQKLSQLSKLTTEIGEKIKSLKGVDDDLYKSESTSHESLEDDGLAIRLDVESTLATLKGLEELIVLAEAKGSKDQVTSDLHALDIQERQLKVQLLKEEGERKHAESKLHEQEVQSRIAANQATSTGGTAAGGTAAPIKKDLGLKIGKTELPRFDGNSLNWFSFWCAFEANVHKNEHYAPYAKLTILRSLLDGIPHTMLRNLDCIDTKYEVAIKMLQSRYADKDLICKKLREQLRSLKPATMDPSSLEDTHVQLESTLQALEAQGKSVNTSDEIRDIILSKFPTEVIKWIRDRADTALSDWQAIPFIRRALSKFVARERESIEYGYSTVSPVINDASPEPVTTLVANSNSRQGHQGQQYQGQRSYQYNQQTRGQQRSGRGRGQGQGQSQRQGQGQRQLNEIKCGYCSGSHFNDDCTIFKSITARRACLAKDNRCDRCLGRGHPRARCFRYRRCFHCLDEGDHHRSLCPKHFPLSDNDPTPNHKSAVLVVQNYGSEDNFSDNLEANQEEPVEVPVNAAQAYPAQSMGTLLQTADTQCRAPGREDTPYERTASLLDSCAGRSFILELVTFASEKPHVVKCQIAWLEIKLCDGTTLIIEITIVPFICKAIRKVNVPPAVVESSTIP